MGVPYLLLLDSDVEIPEDQVLRIFSLHAPLFFLPFLTLRMSVLFSLPPVSGKFGPCLLGMDIGLSTLRFYCVIPFAIAVVVFTAFK